MSKITSGEQEFIEYLENLVSNRDRGAIANLRRGLRKPPGTVPQTDRYVLKFLPEDTRVGQEEPYYLVASLFAFWHQGRDSPENAEGNLGRSARVMVDQEKDLNRRDSLEKSTEKRLVTLLNCHRDDLPEHLRQIVSLLKSRDVSVDWVQLLADIKDWQRDDRTVQRAWARGFWIGSRQREEKEVAHAEPSSSEADED